MTTITITTHDCSLTIPLGYNGLKMLPMMVGAEFCDSIVQGLVFGDRPPLREGHRVRAGVEMDEHGHYLLRLAILTARQWDELFESFAAASSGWDVTEDFARRWVEDYFPADDQYYCPPAIIEAVELLASALGQD